MVLTKVNELRNLFRNSGEGEFSKKFLYSSELITRPGRIHTILLPVRWQVDAF